GIKRSSTPLALFICPSRRAPIQYPVLPSAAVGEAYRNWWMGVQLVTAAGRTDYGAVGGNQSDSTELTPGPTVAQAATPADVEAFFTSDSRGRLWNALPRFNGAIHTRSQTKLINLKRGTSNTLLVAEKWLRPSEYTTGTNGGDNECMYTGFNNDVIRSTFSPPVHDINPASPAFFGSTHTAGINALLGDGSVRVISYSVDANVFREYGDRTSRSPLILAD